MTFVIERRVASGARPKHGVRSIEYAALTAETAHELRIRRVVFLLAQIGSFEAIIADILKGGKPSHLKINHLLKGVFVLLVRFTQQIVVILNI